MYNITLTLKMKEKLSLILLEDKQYWEGRICNVPNFALGHVSAFHTPRLRGRNLQATRCVLGGKSRVKAVTLFLTPSFRLNS